ncbi:MAG: GntR family transcriptional regulator [Anaerolineae bacterium]
MANTLSRDSRLPLYYQLYDLLRLRILTGEYTPGMMLPTEQELMDSLGVSRAVVRQALGELVNGGLVYRQRGKGTFVLPPVIDRGMNKLTSFTEEMHQRGMAPETRVQELTLEEASIEVAEKLRIEHGTPVVFLQRLRMADGAPLALEESHLVCSGCERFLRHNFASEAVRMVLRDEFGIDVTQAHQIVRAIGADRRLSEVLSMPRGAPVLYMERIAYTAEGRPVEYLRLYHRGDRYSFSMDLHA